MNNSCLWVIETSLSKLNLLWRRYLHIGYLTVSLYWNTQHIITDTLNINRHHCFIFFNWFWVKLNFYKSLRLLWNGSRLRMNSELILKNLIFREDFQIVSELNWWSILKDNCLFVVKIIRYFPKVYLWLHFEWIIGIYKLKSWCNYMT